MIEQLAVPSGIGSPGAGVPLRELVLVGATAAAVTYLLTSLVRVFAIRVGAVAVPRARDVHVIPTPRLGGVGMFIGLVSAIALAAQLPALNRGFAYSPDMMAVITAGLVIVLVGVIDDRWGLDALTKFVGQLTAAGVLVIMGVSWNVFNVPVGNIGTLSLDPLQAGLLTVVITVATINAVNFIDGLDGLAAGLGLIAALAICLFSLGQLRELGGDSSYYPPALITVALAGACLGFLPHNFSPARIFMGDSGAMLIGLMLAAASTSASGRISPPFDIRRLSPRTIASNRSRPINRRATALTFAAADGPVSPSACSPCATGGASLLAGSCRMSPCPMMPR